MTNKLLCSCLVLMLAGSALPVRGQTPEADLAKAVTRVEDGEFEDAIPLLDGAARRLAGVRGKSKELARTYLYLAIAYLGLTQEASAKARFVDALASDPDLKLSPKEFPPKVIHLFEEARKDVKASAPAPPPKPDPALSAAFFEAVKRGDFPSVRDMLKQSPALVSEKDASFGASPLHWAALKGHGAVVGFLLAQGADDRALNRDNETPLQVAQRANRRDVVAILASSDPGERLFEAARRNDLATLRQAVQASPDAVRARDGRFGATALHWAALRGNVEACEFLLISGADPAALNKDNETPLQVAQRADRKAVVEFLQDRRIAKAPAAPDLFSAVRAGDFAKVRQMVEADLTAVRQRDAVFGATALHWAALKGHTQIVIYLVSQGADVNAPNGKGETPVKVAERAGKTDVVDFLKSRGGTQ